MRYQSAWLGGLPETLTLYHCTRHTFGAHHVMGGGSLATLREVLGHSSVLVTERYGHLRADLFKPSVLLQLSVDMSRAGGEVIDLAARRDDESAGGNAVATPEVDGDQAASVTTGIASPGGVAERSKATVLKTVARKRRGFESLLLLHR